MNIGIDIDGVLVDLEKFSTDYGTKMCIEEGWKIEINPEGYYETEKFNWTKEQEEKFWNKYLLKYIEETTAREFSAEIIHKLRQENNKIYIITARNESGLPPEAYGKMQQITKKWLSKNKIEYDKIIFAKDEEKLQKCLESNVNVMIEDNPNNILNISKKLPVIKYNCIYNEKMTEKNVTTSYSWYQIYDIINKMKGE